MQGMQTQAESALSDMNWLAAAKTLQPDLALEETVPLVDAMLPSGVNLVTAVNRNCATVAVAISLHDFQDLVVSLCNKLIQSTGKSGNICVCLEPAYLDKEDKSSGWGRGSGLYIRMKITASRGGIGIICSQRNQYQAGELAAVDEILKQCDGWLDSAGCDGDESRFELYLPTAYSSA